MIHKRVTNMVLRSPYVMGSGSLCILKTKIQEIHQEILIEISTANFSKKLADFQIEMGHGPL